MMRIHYKHGRGFRSQTSIWLDHARAIDGPICEECAPLFDIDTFLGDQLEDLFTTDRSENSDSTIPILDDISKTLTSHPCRPDTWAILLDSNLIQFLTSHFAPDSSHMLLKSQFSCFKKVIRYPPVDAIPEIQWDDHLLIEPILELSTWV